VQEILVEMGVGIGAGMNDPVENGGRA